MEPSKNRAVARWQAQGVYGAYLDGLKKLAEDRIPAEDDFAVVAEPPSSPTPQSIEYWRNEWQSDRLKPDWRQDARAAGLSEQRIEEIAFWLKAWQSGRFQSPEHDWHQDARAAGLTEQEIEESWTWYSGNAFAPPPVLEEVQPDRPPISGPMPESARRVLTYNSIYLFLGEDPLIDDLLAKFEEPPETLRREAEDQQFWDDVGRAGFDDPPTDDTREALDNLAKLVRLTPEHVRRLAERRDPPTTMQAEKRRLVHEAVLLSLGAAAERIRIGERKTKDDPAHPITSQEVFGDERDHILSSLRKTLHQSLADIARESLAPVLGGPFRPAQLADREVYRNWLMKEIRRRVVELLGEDLGIEDAGRAGGSRRKEVSYDETEPLPGVARGRLGADTQAFTHNQMLATGEREEQGAASFRTTEDRTKLLRRAESKDRLELSLAHAIDWGRVLDRIWREREAPVLRQYIDCVRNEPLLMDDDAAAAQQLQWEPAKVRDVKRRLNGHLTLVLAQQRWKSIQSKTL